MRTYVRFLSPEKFVAYTQRPDAKIIGGTVFAETFDALRGALAAASGGDEIAHLTISLPQGLTTDDETFCKIVSTELKNRGLNPVATPWVAVRHYDTVCHHIHVAVAQRTWTGRPVPFWNSEGLSDRNEDLLREAVGLPLFPRFDENASPQLLPPSPRRKRKGKLASRVYYVLREIFRHEQPHDIGQLQSALKDRLPNYRIVPGKNGHGVDNWRIEAPAENKGKTKWMSLGGLGLAWEPRHLKRRFDLTRHLATLRPVLQLRLLARRLTEIETRLKNERELHHDPSGTQGTGHPIPKRTPVQGYGFDQGDAPGTSAIAGPAQDAGLGSGERDDRTPVRPDGGGPGGAARIAREHVQPAGRAAEVASRDRGAEDADGTGQPNDQGDAQFSDGHRRHTVAAWLGGLRRSIDGKGRLERITRNKDGRLTAKIAYPDGSHDEVVRLGREENTGRDQLGPDGP